MMKTLLSQKFICAVLFCILQSAIFVASSAQGVGNHITMSLQNCTQVDSVTIRFDLYVVSDGASTSDIRANSFQYGVNFNTACLHPGAFIAPSFVNGTSDFIPPLNTFTFSGSTNDHIKIVEAIYGGGNPGPAYTMVIGQPYRVGTFQLVSYGFVAGCCPNFTLQTSSASGKTVCAALIYIGNSSSTQSISVTGTVDFERSVFVNCNLCLTDVNEYDLDKSISIYPNPGNGTFMISLINMRNATLRIFNVLGAEVYSEGINNKQEITGLKLDPGIYFVHVTEGERQYLRKLLIE